MRFDFPWALLLLALLPLLCTWQLRRKLFTLLRLPRALYSEPTALPFSSPLDLAALPTSPRTRWREPILNLLLPLSYSLLVFALARPQTGTYFAETLASGRDIMFVLDVSGSMAALDFKLEGKHVQRLDALKHVTTQFIERRSGDRAGLVLFGKTVFTQCPLTVDHRVLKEYLASLEVGMLGDSTAIGDGIGVALKRLREIKADSRVLVLVTDGVQTSGALSAKEAAEIAKELGVKIYTIGIGGKGPAPFKVTNSFGVEVIDYAEVQMDEETLREIAALTGGQYFNAVNTAQLEGVFKEIDSLEERKDLTFEYVEYEEHFGQCLLLGIALFLLHEVLALTVFAIIPEG